MKRITFGGIAIGVIILTTGCTSTSTGSQQVSLSSAPPSSASKSTATLDAATTGWFTAKNALLALPACAKMQATVTG